jgi:allophanate hydrolase
MPFGLYAAGGINFGKTNLDQFASGLVGTRTPYGTAANAFDDRFIPGGSSSGSAAAVGAGLLCFALGTDTAGSGRVPAGYNGCVGLKGTLGKISTVGEWRRRYSTQFGCLLH